MAKRDYYELLGVDKTADAEELKRAYRKQAMQFHPDRNPGNAEAEQMFKDISEAYEVLKDEQRRAAYDRHGHAAFEQGGPGPGAGGFGFGNGFADIFDEMFGEIMGRRNQGGQTRGADLRYNMEISLEEAFAGKEATINVATTIACETCEGSGAEPGSKPVACPTCGGAGKIRAQQGFFTIERTCSTCQGGGRVIDKPCKTCSGSGRTRREKTLSVTIPAGVENGTRIRLAGEGEAGSRVSPSGDLYIFLSLKPHRLFQRDGANVFCRVPIPMTTAALGGQIEVPTVEGARARITVPAGTQTGHQFRLRTKGMSVLHSTQRGDMYVEAVIETPVNLTKKQQDLLKEFDKSGDGGETSPESAGFFAKAKELWEDLRK